MLYCYTPSNSQWLSCTSCIYEAHSFTTAFLMRTCFPNVCHKKKMCVHVCDLREESRGWNKVTVISIRSFDGGSPCVPILPDTSLSTHSVQMCVRPEPVFHDKCVQASGAAVLRKDTNLKWQDSQWCAAQRGPALWRRPESLARSGHQ